MGCHSTWSGRGQGPAQRNNPGLPPCPWTPVPGEFLSRRADSSAERAADASWRGGLLAEGLLPLTQHGHPGSRPSPAHTQLSGVWVPSGEPSPAGKPGRGGGATGTGQDTVRWGFQKNEALSFSVKGIGPKEWKAGTSTEPRTPLFIIALFTRTKCGNGRPLMDA